MQQQGKQGALHKSLNVIRLLFHLFAVMQFSYGIYYDYTYVRFPATATHVRSTFGGKFKYLTFLDAIVQALYYTIALLNDILGSNELAPKRLPLLRQLKDYIFAAFAFPLAMNVGTTFWGIYAVDRELVFPRILDSVFPTWLNHVVHTCIMVFIVLELFTSYRAYPSTKRGLTGLTVFMLIYLVWIHIVKHYSGAWVYPILEALPLLYRNLFFVGIFLYTALLYVIGDKLSSFVWRQELKTSKAIGRKHK